MKTAKYGIQMYSLRDVSHTDLRKALQLVGEMGYDHVEFAGFFGNAAEDVKAWLEEYGLECSGTHTGIEAISPENIDATITFHKTIGCDMLILPGCDRSTREKMDNVIATLNAADKKLAENGITLGYHNHSQEFLPTPYGVVFEDEVLKQTSVALEIDTFWLFNAGFDVIPYLDAHKDRIKRVHLKDGIPAPEENKNYEHIHDDVTGTALGEGKAPVQAVREWAMKNNVPMVVESEGLTPTGPEEVKRCIDYLRVLDK